MDQETADKIWNRACLDDGRYEPMAGDKALTALLYAHGLIMNGGVDHAMEIMSDSEAIVAIAGFRFFGLEAVAILLETGKGNESDKDREYLEIANDSALGSAFEAYFKKSPQDFAPTT
jgi:hypothetical protein